MSNNNKEQIKDNIFREQIKEDIQELKESLWSLKSRDEDYIFNYWILNNIYSLDKEMCVGNVTEGSSDKGIDCFVHYEEDKELYIIQNKYYSEETELKTKDLTNFLDLPRATLNQNEYKTSEGLQKIYNECKDDPAYKIFFHFYVTNDLNPPKDVKNIIEDRKRIIEIVNKQKNTSRHILELFYLSDLKNKYYGKTYIENKKFVFDLSTENKATFLSARENYGLPSPAFYVMTKVSDVFKLWEDAKNENYPLFEKNIREYLGGTSGINKKIIDTLKDEKERKNFFYYNNGITIICDYDRTIPVRGNKIKLENPQVVNGCQTVNSIVEVLKDANDADQDKYSEVYVMVKILMLTKEKKDTEFYKDIVKYTNSQNAINEKVFGATDNNRFSKIKENLKTYGILTSVKQSDSFQFKEEYKNNKESFAEIIATANKNSGKLYTFKTVKELEIKLETLLQIIGALFIDAHFAYVKKSHLLKPTSKEYLEFSYNIGKGEKMTSESMSKLVFLYKRAEKDKKDEKDKKTFSPYYLINFIGRYLKNNEIDIQEFFKNVTSSDLLIVYESFKELSTDYFEKYKEKYHMEYNTIIKKQIDDEIMDEVLNTHIKILKKYNSDDYDELMEIFEKNR